MKILIIVDKIGSAIWRLAEVVKKYNEHLFIDILPFHPKRYSSDDLRLFEEKAHQANLVDFEYWKSALVLLERFSWLKNKPKVLTHHNPYDLDKSDWRQFDIVVVKNRTQQAKLRNSVYIPHCVDLDFFQFNSDYCSDCHTCPHKCRNVGMVAWRIEKHKGIKEVARACKELGYKFILVGKISKPSYFQEILEVNPEIDFRQEISDEELRETYKEMSVLVCNSVDNFETGPLPILEAMASGVPVLTRNVGIVPDIYDGKNLYIRRGKTNDIEDLKSSLRTLIENNELRLSLRDRGWNTVKNFSTLKMARLYARLYHHVLFKEPLVSVIIPTFNRKEQVIEILKSLDNQIYENIEVIIADDGSTDGTESAVKSLREEVRYPIKYINTGNKPEEYGLAKARNMGAIEADGEVLVFCDSRLKPFSDAIMQFASKILPDKEKIWYFGNKGSGKRSFVENFSAIRRSHFIQAGMFCERINLYGGLTQETMTRFRAQGFKFRYLPFAQAKQILSSRSRKKKSDIWKAKFQLWKMYG